MGTQGQGQRPFNRIVFTYAWVIGIGLVIVIAHALSKSKATPAYAGGVSQLPLEVRSGSDTGSAATSAAPGTPAGAAAQASPITAKTALHAIGGVPVYSTDFAQPDRIVAGWPIGPQQNVDIELHPDGYAIVGSGRYVSLVDAPVDQSYNQIEVSAGAKESTNPPPGAGFGVFCGLGSVGYDFDVSANGTWSIRRGDEPQFFEIRDTSIAIAHGPLTASLSSGVSIAGVCAQLPGTSSVRLAMFVDGAEVADLLDTQPAAGSGWRAGIVSTDADLSSSTTTFVNFAMTTFDMIAESSPPQAPRPTDSSGVQT